MISPHTYKRWVWFVHVLFWTVFVALVVIILAGILKRVDQAILLSLPSLVGMLVLVYVHLNVLVPRFFIPKRYWLFGMWLFLLVLATTGFRIVVSRALINWLGWEELTIFIGSNLYVGTFFGSLFMLMLSIPLYLIENWLKRTELEKELTTQSLEAELRFLKAQVNPHFLFNALNNIYALSFTQSAKAPEMILKLSEMMSYMLYECKGETVRLESELVYLKNFIDLQQLKKDGEQHIQFEVSGPLEAIQIPPMLLIPFFENAFKHGNIDDTTAGWLSSSLEVVNQQISFHIRNSVNPNRRKAPPGGVGLANVRERLRLIYPDKHTLIIQSQEKEFSVHLTLDLS
ncbi:MAG: histidine kinase [Bacteroidota bacterium]